MPQSKRRKTTYQINKGVNQKTSKYTLSDAQVFDLYNMDFNIPNALSKRPGSTNMVTANTSGPINSLFEFEKLGGESYMLAGSDTAMFEYAGGSLNPIATGYANGQAFDILAFIDKAFFTNGETFREWTGESLFQYSLVTPGATSQRFGINGAGSATYLGYASAGLQVAYKYSFVRHDGFESPVANDRRIHFYGQSAQATTSFTEYRVPGVTYPANVSYLNMYLALSRSTLAFAGLSLNPNTQYGTVIDNIPDVPLEAFRFITTVPLGTTSVFIDPNAFNFENIIFQRDAPEYTFELSMSYTPRFIELNQNRMFMFGFSTAPSSVFFSEIGLPRRVRPEYNFEVRTNDSDVVTAGKSYNDQMIFFKRNSFHKLVGDSPDNYDLAELSTEYGCLSNQAVVEYDNLLLFLDEKGVVKFNGSDWGIISHPVEPVFRRMNIGAAIQKAVAVHYDFRNQVWFGIPVDGSTVNNLTVVYDYLLGAWTFFDGFEPASFALAKRDLEIDRLWYGDYSGNISYFSPSFYGDNGAGITCLIDTKFDSPDGANIENMFRRLFLDVNEVSGVTGVIDVEVYRNYDRTARATFAIYQNQFQTRKEFGVPGKSVAFKMTHNSASLPLDLYGYTVHRRYLRDV